MGKRRITLFITFNGEPNDDSLLAFRVGEALVNRFKGIGEMEAQAFTPGGGFVEKVDIAVGNTKLAEVTNKHPGYHAVSTSDLKHG